MTTSKLFTINWRDLAHGLIMAAGGGAINIIVESLSKKEFILDFTDIWHGALIAGVAYLSKRFFTPSQYMSTNS